MSVESLLTKILSRLDAIEGQIGGGSAGGAPTAAGGSSAKQVEKFDDYLANTLPPFIAAMHKLGGDMTGLAAVVESAWAEQRKFICMASECKSPENADLMNLLGPIAEKMKEVSGSIKRNEWTSHCEALKEGVSSLNWLCVKPGPVDIVETGLDGFTFRTNKIRKEFKESNPDQIAFCNTGKAVFSGLVEYVKEYHKMGLVWKPQGGDAKAWSGGTAPAAASAPVTAPAKATSSIGGGTESKAGLFSALNAGIGITSGLKKVTKDMKSSNLDTPPAVPKAIPKAVVPRTNTNVPKGPPKCELGGGGRWAIENQTGACTVEITDNLKQSVYIYGCIGATITVKGKCKSIAVDKCTKTKVLFEETFASFEVVNCKQQHVNIGRACSAMSIDKTDGITVFVPAEAKEALEISASKSSEMNVQWMDGDDELVEKPIPEQYVHRIKGGKVTVEVSELYSS